MAPQTLVELLRNTRGAVDVPPKRQSARSRLLADSGALPLQKHSTQWPRIRCALVRMPKDTKPATPQGAVCHVPATNHFAAAPRLDARNQDRFGGIYVDICFTSDVGTTNSWSCEVLRRGPW
jgi:hypothetical protein